MSSHQSLIHVLSSPKSSMIVTGLQVLQEIYPDMYVELVTAPAFAPGFWHKPWKLRASTQHPDPGVLALNFHERTGLFWEFVGGQFEVIWDGETTQLYKIQVPADYGTKDVWYVIGKDKPSTVAWIERICKVCANTERVIFVYEDSCWRPSRELYDSIQSSSLDDLILAGNLKEQLVSDIQNFLEQESIYTELNVPWKRGFCFWAPQEMARHTSSARLRTL